ncbi:MAG: DNA polymerase III subunit delta' [Candidatus Omnitrophica bacterium]|nr:DNA polymerase III subunit delta' [Candidatus Omnitrophota bacterium]
MSFKDLKAQDKAVYLLESILKSRRIAPALLFWGEEGVGKKLAAVNFAKALNCLENNVSPCQECASCRKIDNHNHPDVFFLPKDDLSEAIKIEEIRQLQKIASLKSLEAKKKVFIIDQAHNLTPEAANAFLKILEEPPADTLFILITSKPELMFSTIRSRCQSVRFCAMPKKDLSNVLQKDFGVEPKTSHYLAYFYQGRLGASLRMKDNDILRRKNRIIQWLMDEYDDAQEIERQNKRELKESLEILLSWFRDIYLIKTGLAHSELIHLDLINQLLETMPRLSFYDLDTAINFLSDASLYLEQNVNPKLILANLKARLWTKLRR